MSKTRSPGLAIEQQCRICHEPLKPHEKPRPGEPGLCDSCLRANQSTITQYNAESEAV